MAAGYVKSSILDDTFRVSARAFFYFPFPLVGALTVPKAFSHPLVSENNRRRGNPLYRNPNLFKCRLFFLKNFHNLDP